MDAYNMFNKNNLNKCNSQLTQWPLVNNYK